ncbi:MAG TPA: helix-turn-helix domain-containing protein [Gordonia sp. (in: high G+C Gram-positive bacteria)]|uniref:TetR/AcrR family transcriptional regulator n=1 Tax=unclassified Gordonia (in: high G+C Gram-positive bacteria) TaxID=2657482 RepID=UPI000F9EFDA8|nr:MULTISPECIES: TetR/AcrR family transcriptional regulator [unclassified Gordonia (in: high G+C Gram-positive bacteria)]RUP39883.1 MAG: TetR family transcriptional regulator [Gordonia sp. (in: high G+C Gram-positive bacteria)]HNP56732.1 helix-turn-helix domain-containing protein [Gordonia sp. (in: high G+C Gram-positive bacteria)]HRC51890.1 helix-turn-helix domain-containing protein [Gordonia sp. (in: high G+C Gram-positive bacteria)]
MSAPAAPSNPPTQRDKNRARTRRDIETAALELFEAKGYQETTVEEIARTAGCSSATFFRHFGSKEDVLFANEDEAARSLARFTADRPDRSQQLGALAQPVSQFAQSFLTEATSDAHRLTRLVMTTPDLEARSLRMRLKWEHALSRTLAGERGDEGPSFDQVLLASLAVSCLSTALWQWQDAGDSASIGAETLRAFERAAAAITGG